MCLLWWKGLWQIVSRNVEVLTGSGLAASSYDLLLFLCSVVADYSLHLFTALFPCNCLLHLGCVACVVLSVLRGLMGCDSGSRCVDGLWLWQWLWRGFLTHERMHERNRNRVIYVFMVVQSLYSFHSTRRSGWNLKLGGRVQEFDEVIDWLPDWLMVLVLVI